MPRSPSDEDPILVKPRTSKFGSKCYNVGLATGAFNPKRGRYSCVLIKSLILNMTHVIMQTYVHAHTPCTDMHATYMHAHIRVYAYFYVPDGVYICAKGSGAW